MIMAFGITMPGVPFLYYGNEIGMRQLYGKPPDRGRLLSALGRTDAHAVDRGRRTWASRPRMRRSSICRSTTAADAPNVEAQQADPASLLNRVRKLIAPQAPGAGTLPATRTSSPSTPRPTPIPSSTRAATGKDLLLAIFNPAARPEIAEVTLPTPFKKLVLAAGRETKNTKTGQTLKIEVPGVTWALYRVQ